MGPSAASRGPLRRGPLPGARRTGEPLRASGGPDVTGLQRHPADREPVEIPIDGVLDLHTFRPAEVGVLVPEYLRACRERGILELRIIHGKGSGVLRRTVHALLDRDGAVVSYRLAGPAAGGWGATLATLAPGDGFTPSR